MLKFAGTALTQSVLRFVRSDSGATAIEYALIASGVGVVIAATVVGLGSKVSGMFLTVSTALK